MLKSILAICTVLGGIAALAYFIEKALAKRRLHLPVESHFYEDTDAGLRSMWTNKQLRAASAGTLLFVSVTIGAYFLLRPSAIDRMAALIEDQLVEHCDKAIITGHTIPNGSETFAWFEWGETPDMGRETIKQRFTEEADYYQHLAPLKENTTYYYKSVSENAYGRTDAEVRTFTTPHCSNWTENRDSARLIERVQGTGNEKASKQAHNQRVKQVSRVLVRSESIKIITA